MDKNGFEKASTFFDVIGALLGKLQIQADPRNAETHAAGRAARGARCGGFRGILAACLLALCGAGHPAMALTEMPQLLQAGIPITFLDGLTGSEVVYRVVVPSGSRDLKFISSGGWGDCDLYARFGAHPDTLAFDQASKSLSTKEAITVQAPHEGVWYVMVHGYAAFSGVSLVAQYQRAPFSAAIPQFSPGPGLFNQAARIQLHSATTGARIYYTTDGSDPTEASLRYRQPIVLNETVVLKARAFLGNGKQSPVADGTFEFLPDGGPEELQSGVPVFPLAGNHGNLTYFKIHAGAGEQLLRVATSDGSGSSAIYLSYGAPPTITHFNRRANGPRNFAQIEVNNPAEGDWFVALLGVSNYSGVALLATTSSRESDLIVWTAALKPYVTEEVFLPGDCSVVEGLIEAGTHRLLRFTTETRNIGQADLVMGSPVGNPAFEYAPCHGHYHFKGFASYRLLDLQKQVVATGRKVSFCLEDVSQWNPKAPADPKYDCTTQGIHSGWADVYDSGLPGQWVDVTGVPTGKYFLEVTMNPLQILSEADYGNNTTRLLVTIGTP